MPRKPSSPDEVSLVYALGRVNHGIRREMRARLARLGLSITEFTALSVLDHRPGLSNAQLARRTMVTPQSMIETLSSLEERGLVRRRRDPDHARIRRTELTGAGRRLLARAEPRILRLQDEMLQDVPDSVRQLVLEAMLKAMTRLSTDLEGSVSSGRAAAQRSA